jgi:ABC-type transport system involved in cytochrome bd biosynthesis fused ATPase/permease subunit
MFDNFFNYILANGLAETLSVGIIPSTLLLIAFLLVYKIVQMNKTTNSRTVQAFLKKQKKDLKAIRELKLQGEREQAEDEIAAKGKVNHLREKVARIKAANEETRNKYKEWYKE